MNDLVTLLLIFTFAFTASCGASIQSRSESSNSDPSANSNAIVSTGSTPSSSLTIPSSFDEQAMKLAKDEFNIIWIQCGNSYYTMDRDLPDTNTDPYYLKYIKPHIRKVSHYYQWRDVSFKLNSDPVTESDRTNGIEWRGNGDVHASEFRESYENENHLHWGDWQQGFQDKGTGQSINITKNKTGWDVQLVLLTKERYKKPTCNEVAKVLENPGYTNQ